MHLHKPGRLLPGDTIAVAAPASLPVDLTTIEKGIATLTSRGYRVEVGRSAFEHHGYLSGPDELRAREFNAFLRRPDVSAIIAVRGGYGTLRILDRIDYAAARRHPKLIVGYSDITAIQLAMLSQAGVPSISGPMIAVEWGAPDEASEELFWDLTRGAAPDPLLGPEGEGLRGVRDGEVFGPLIGGNLTLISRLIGTPYLPDLTGAILFLEEVGEEPYRVDGLLAHLRLSGIFDRIGGLVVGGFTEWVPTHDRPTLELAQVIDHYLEGLRCPIARGLQYGHFPAKNSLPIGVKARLTVEGEDATLSLLEPVVD